MPLITGNFDIHAVDLIAAAFNDAVKPDIVFKRIGADNVVVVFVNETDSNSTCLIDAPSDRLEPYGYLKVSGDHWFKNGQRKTIVRSLRARLFNRSASKSGLIANDRPFSRARSEEHTSELQSRENLV